MSGAKSEQNPRVVKTGVKEYPPTRELLSNTRVLIDWLSVTYHAHVYAELTNLSGGETTHWRDTRAGVQANFELLTGCAGMLKTSKARHGYEMGLESESGVKVWFCSDLSPMGVHVVYSGKALNNFDALELLDMHLSRGASITRIDIAADTETFELTPERLYGAFQGGEAQCRARKAALMQSTTGATLYIGSRSSANYLRVYDKAGQQGLIGCIWYRAELETKGKRAEGIARFLVQQGSLDGIPDIINGFCNFPKDVEWVAAMSDNVEKVRIDSERGETNTADWLVNSVSKTLAKCMLEDQRILDEFVTATLKSYFARKVG